MTRKHIHIYETRYHAVAKYAIAIRASGDFAFMRGAMAIIDR